MVALSTDSPNPENAEDPAGIPAPSRHPRPRSQLEQLIQSLSAAARLQMQILTLRVQTTLKKLLITLILTAAAVIAALAGIMFLYISVFHMLTDFAHMPVAWAWLIFAAVHVLTAGILFLIAAFQWKPAAQKAQETAP